MDRMRDSGSLGYGSIPYRRTKKTRGGFKYEIRLISRQVLKN